MENDEEETRSVPEAAPQSQPRCRFFSQGKHCYFGKKCKFLHVRDMPRTSDGTNNPAPTQPDALPAALSGTTAPAHTRPCRYFLSGYCSMEEHCRFWHSSHTPSIHDPPNLSSQTSHKMVPVRCPVLIQEVKVSELTEEVSQKLRDTEIQQLKKRFPTDQLIVQEREDGLVTYYRATVQATDPDWPFDLKEVDIMISFPDNYPQQIFELEIPLDQQLPAIMTRHVQQASVEWLQAKHATNQLLGKVELLFRPFLRWLDRSLERLFIEGAKQLKKDMDLEKAGLQFISYQELQATVSERSDGASDGPEEAQAGVKDEEEGVTRDEPMGEHLSTPCEQEEQEEGSRLVENIKLSDPRRGTEVKLLGLRLGENTATVVAQSITVCLQCNRCKVIAELSLSGRTACTAQCDKCSAGITAAFRPCMIHHYSDVLGYLDLQNTAPSDLVLKDCHFTVGCLSCSQDTAVEDLLYGQTKEVNCAQCHSKLSVEVESCRFQFIQARAHKPGAGANAVDYKSIRNPAVQKGKPLPEKGTCKHYKQSHRWLRFPCCGRAYACDVCHDEDQDHPMELATRMICGYCAKEQAYGNGKPCVSCGTMMTRGTRTSHWEGGLGCRNKVKMSRNDRQKYANTNKTVSRKAAGDKK